MKKRLISLLFISALGLTLTACGKQKLAPDNVRDMGDGLVADIDKLPYEMEYNDVSLPLTEIEVYQNKENYQYHVYVTLKINTENVSDEDLYWLDQEPTNAMLQKKILEPKLYLTNEANSIEKDSLTRVGSCDFDGYRMYFFIPLETYKNELATSTIDIEVDIAQDETYGDHDYNKINEYYYSISYDKDNPFKDTSEMPEDVEQQFIVAMNSFNSALKDFTNY